MSVETTRYVASLPPTLIRRFKTAVSIERETTEKSEVALPESAVVARLMETYIAGQKNGRR